MADGDAAKFADVMPVLARVTPDAIAEAHRRIAPDIRTTPVIEVAAADLGLSGLLVTLKLEGLQNAGSHKVRGVFAQIDRDSIPASGLAMASNTNHGVAVAYAARVLGCRSRVFVTTMADRPQIARLRGFGAEIVLSGTSDVAAEDQCRHYVSQSGAIAVSACESVHSLAGCGTLALELCKQATVDTVLVPVGSGALIAGIATWYAGRNVRIVGVESVRAPALSEAIKMGRPVAVAPSGLTVGSLGVRRSSAIVLPIVMAHVDRIVSVNDAAIHASQLLLWRSLRLVVEPGGAAALAALTSRAYVPEPSERVAVVLTGSNVGIEDFGR